VLFRSKSAKSNETQQSNSNTANNIEIKINIEKIDNERLEAEDFFSSSSNEDFKGRIEMETTSDHALSQLEDRIKRWHFKNGCKSPFIPKFNRIDLEKINSDIKAGGKIVIKLRRRSESNEANAYTSAHRDSGSSGISSGCGDMNDSDEDFSPDSYDMKRDLLEFFTLYHPNDKNKHHQSLSSQLSNSRRATLAETQTAASTTTAANLEKENDSREFEIGKSFISVLLGDKSAFASRHRLSLPRTNNNNNYKKKSSIDLNDVSSLVENATKIRIKRNSLPAKFMSESQVQEHEAMSRKESLIINPNDSQKSRHNSTVFQYSPYMFRKLSMSHAKVRNRHGDNN